MANSKVVNPFERVASARVLHPRKACSPRVVTVSGMVISVRLEQFRNADAPMDSSPSGRVTFFRFVFPKKAPYSMVLMFSPKVISSSAGEYEKALLMEVRPSPIATVRKLDDPVKEFSPRNVTEFGIRRASKLGRDPNAPSSIVVRPSFKTTVVSESQPLKALSEMIWTLDGIWISTKFSQSSKVENPICVMLRPKLIVARFEHPWKRLADSSSRPSPRKISESALQFSKARLPRETTLSGIVMDVRPVHSEKALSLISVKLVGRVTPVSREQRAKALRSIVVTATSSITLGMTRLPDAVVLHPVILILPELCV